MREIKSGLGDAKRQHDVVVLQNIPHHQGLVRANRFLLLLASLLMVIVFVLGFLLLPTDNMLDDFKSSPQDNSVAYAIQNPVLSAEINTLKGQLVGLISGSIESKLRILEQSVRTGSITASLGTIQDLRNDVRVLRSYSSVAEKKEVEKPVNEALLKEVSQLKDLIYLTLASCGLMIAAIGGIWVRNRSRLEHPDSFKRTELGKHK
jgi:hypothetical protein